MKHKAQYTNKQLRALQRKGHDVFPVFGRPVNMVNLQYLPRTKFDPKPWVWGSTDGIRYSAYELTTAPHIATPAELVDQKHRLVEDHDLLDVAFSRLADRVGAQGVAA